MRQNTGIAYSTIVLIQRGGTLEPRPETLEKIVKWLKEN